MKTAWIALILVGCGGSKPSEKATEPVVAAGDEPAPGEPAAGDQPAAGDVVPVPVMLPPDAGPPPPPASPYTFVLENKGKTELAFHIDKGWQQSLFAYTGKPPKAKAALVFPTWCTETCDAAADAMCPICKEPKEPKDRQKRDKEESRREVVAAGASFTMDWDGQLLAYEKAPKEARTKKKRCECWRKIDPAPETYTFKACGFRPAPEPGKPSIVACAEAQVALPAATTPAVITLSFP